jgi:hypothetical protein
MDSRHSIEPRLYRHYKGGLYSVLGMELDSESKEVRVSYLSHQDGCRWSRLASMWYEKVQLEDGTERLRFERVKLEEGSSRILLMGEDGVVFAELAVPPFHKSPEVLQWGDRHFVRREPGLYQEVFSYAVRYVVDPSPIAVRAR